MTATMARKKPKSGSQSPTEQAQGRSGKSIQLYIPPDLADAFDAHVDASRPKTTKTAIIVMLLEDFLRKAGTWPPSGASEGGAGEEDEPKGGKK